jgi:hypothetical protein
MFHHKRRDLFIGQITLFKKMQLYHLNRALYPDVLAVLEVNVLRYAMD